MMSLIVFMPLLYVARHLRVDITLLVNEVNTLIHINNNVEEQINAFAGLEHRGHHRNTEELSEGLMVEFVAPFLKLVVHVQGAYHSEVHVHELGGEIKVALEVAGIEHVEHYIRRLVYDLPSYVEFLGRIGRKGVSAGQVDDIEVVTLERCRRLLGIHCHSRVVAHVFMCPRREIE